MTVRSEGSASTRACGPPLSEGTPDCYPRAGFLAWFIRRLENKGLKAIEPFLVERGLEWGLEYLGIESRVGDPKELIRQYSDCHTAHSKEYFTPSRIALEDYSLSDRNVLTFPSSIRSKHPNSDTVYCDYFPLRSKSAVIVVPHWCADGKSQSALCRLLNVSGHAALRISLPYHDQRMPPGHAVAYDMVSSNIGLTIAAMRQSVHDIVRCLDWLNDRGFEKIGLVGMSIGSCAAYLAACHEPRIRALVNILMSSYFGEVVWTGAFTQHIRRGLGGDLTCQELRDLWILNSPINFIQFCRRYNPDLRNLIISGRYDSTFLPYLTRLVYEENRKHRVAFERRTLPCGHYSMGEFPFNLMNAYQIVSFFKRAL